jgi:protein-disulfide isomerase
MPSVSSCVRAAAVFASLGLAALGLSALGTQRARAEMSASQRVDIENVVKDYLMAHPEVLRDALNELDSREKAQAAAQTAQAVETNRQVIFDSPHETVLGNPNGKITLVEMFDYNCPHCRNVIGDLGRLMQANPDLRFVLKDFPILTPQSVEAARVAIALRSQFHGEKFWDFYKKLMTERGLVGQPEALAAAKEMGADMAKLSRDMAGPEVSASLKEVGQIADDVHAEGTPTFILGDSVYAGEMTFDQMTPLIDNMRKCGKAACGA